MKTTISCLAITEYKKCPVTILNFDYSFIQLFVYKGAFQYRHDYFKPEWYYRLRWRLGLNKFPFPPKELDQIKSAILEDAFKRVDKLYKSDELLLKKLEK